MTHFFRVFALFVLFAIGGLSLAAQTATASDTGDIAANENTTVAAGNIASGTTAPTTGDPQAAIGNADASYAGAFQWSYPILIPAGTAGMQPNLSISYNSAAPNGYLGMGFSLSGLSVIERDPSRGINFTVADQYTLDGQKLYCTGTDKTFHPERESYDLIQAFSPTASFSSAAAIPNAFDSYWVVSKKDGTKFFYGQTADSRIAAVGKSDAQGRALPRLWALNKVMDPNGNYYSIEYLQDGTGAYYPKAINFTKNDEYTISTWKAPRRFKWVTTI
jgi:hypothetical protein